jgi:hypothetical protein
LEI